MRRSIIFTALLSLMLLLLGRARETAELTREALRLCASSVIPALFPLMVLSSLFVALGCAQVLRRPLSPFIRRLFRCSGTGGTAFFLGLLGGYPLGARTVGDLFRAGEIPLPEAQRLLTFCNNAGPAFIISVAGLHCFGDERAGVALYLIHVLSAVMTGMLCCRFSVPVSPRCTESVPVRRQISKHPAAAAVECIGGAGITAIQITAFVTFFRVLLQSVHTLTHLRHPLLLGFVELTCGIVELGGTGPDFIMVAALLGWGGLSVHCQTAAVLDGTGLSLRPYLAAKFLHALLSAALAALTVLCFS